MIKKRKNALIASLGVYVLCVAYLPPKHGILGKWVIDIGWAWDGEYPPIPFRQKFQTYWIPPKHEWGLAASSIWTEE